MYDDHREGEVDIDESAEGCFAETGEGNVKNSDFTSPGGDWAGAPGVGLTGVTRTGGVSEPSRCSSLTVLPSWLQPSVVHDSMSDRCPPSWRPSWEPTSETSCSSEFPKSNDGVFLKYSLTFSQALSKCKSSLLLAAATQ